MAKNQKFVVTGIEELNSLFSTLPANLTKKAIRKALREEAKELQKIAKSKLPKDSGEVIKKTKI